MRRKLAIEPPFFEIGPKNYLFGEQIIDLAKIADEAAAKYDVRVIYTTPYANIEKVASFAKNLMVFAPHMDAIPVGRGLAHVLPESVKAAGAVGVMLNHTERQLTIATLANTLSRARTLGLISIVCADSIAETRSVAQLSPDLMITEPTELIGTGQIGSTAYVSESFRAVMEINPNIGVLVSGGVSSAQDVYNIIMAGADATGCSSGIVKAADPGAMIHEMLSALRQSWDERKSN